MVLYVIANY